MDQVVSASGARSYAAVRESELLGIGVIDGKVDVEGAIAVRLAVDVAERGIGVGTAIARRIREHLSEHPTFLYSLKLRDDAAVGRRFAEQHGMTLASHNLGWSWDLTRAPGVEDLALRTAQRANVTTRIGSFDQERELLEPLLISALKGMPTPTNRPLKLSEALRHLGTDNVVIVADISGRPVGLTVLHAGTSSSSWVTQFTGVIECCRGRGIARALKMASFQFASAQGGKQMSTYNDSRNASIIALNKQIGMVPDVGYWTFVSN
ncbi:hypothetical protein ACWCQW_54000 [Streptomyces mirabilis]